MTTIRSAAWVWILLPVVSAAAGQVYYVQDYYPVDPNLRWLHQEESVSYDGREDSFPVNRQVLPDPVEVGGVVTTVVERSAFRRTYAEDFLTTNSGLTMHKQVWYELDQNGVPVQYPLYLTPGLSMAPAAMRVGDTWSFTSAISGWNSALGHYSGTTRMDGKLISLETVSVKAGIFANALRIDAVYTRDVTGENGSQVSTNTMSMWLAKDVGVVKDTESIKQTQGGLTRTSQYAMELLAGPQQIKVIPGVPEYRWNYGCAPTSAAMILGHYDRQTPYANLEPGFQMPDKDWADRDGDGDSLGHDSAPAIRKDRFGQPLREGTRGTGDYSAETNPAGYSSLDKVIASEEHVRDYWWGDNGGSGPYDDAYDQKTGASDPWHQMVAQPHVDNCLADYMACSKATQKDGWIASPDDVISALDKWAKNNGFKSTYSKKTGGTYEQMFDFIKDHIDQGQPLILRWPGHFVVCDGYLDGKDKYDWLAIHDTWMDGESNGRAFPQDGGKTYSVDGMYPGETEWWRFRVTSDTFGFVTHAIAWQPLLPGRKGPAYGELFGDSFDRSPDDNGLGGGYAVTASSLNGAVDLVASPLDVENPVLCLSMPDADGFVAVETDVATADLTAISFDYLFATDGKLSVLLDDRLLAEIVCPASGLGSVGADQFASFYQVFPLGDMGFDTTEMLRLKILLSNLGDPTAYLDDLSVWGIEGVPEPPCSLLAASGLLGLLAFRVRRRIAVTRRRST